MPRRHFLLALSAFFLSKKCTHLHCLTWYGETMDAPVAPASSAGPLPFSLQDWDVPPPAVQASLRTMQPDLAALPQRVDTLETRLHQHSTTSPRPPSADHPDKKPRQRSAQGTPRKAGGNPGHPGHRQVLFLPPAVHELQPVRCACGTTTFAGTTPSSTPQGIALPPIEGEIQPLVWPQGWWTACGTRKQAQLPPEHAPGSGPRCTALLGELAGTQGTSRRLLHNCCASGLQVPLRLGALQKLSARVSQALEPHDGASAPQARQAPVHDLDATAWCLTHALQWVRVRVRDTGALSRIHPHRSQAALAALIADWQGLLVSAGYGVSHTWVACRHTCLAHLSRTARGWAERQPPALAAGGVGALAELQRLCPMATALPTGGEWRAWYARLCKVIAQSHDRPDDAGKCARRLRREMDSLWVLLAPHGVDPTHHRAARAWRFGVLWRKRSYGTARLTGNRGVERLLSLKETCRLHARSTSTVLGDAVSRVFTHRQPDLPWIGQQ